MYHPRLKGEHYSMGLKMGQVFKKGNARFPIRLDKFQKEFGKASGSMLQSHFPEAASEIKGITDVIGYDNEVFTSWMMCMGCCLDLDNETGIEIRGCTAFSFYDKGVVIYGRNNDLPPYLKTVSKSIYYQPEEGNKFILNTSSFINGEEGINEHGLAAAMTFVKPKRDEIKPGLNSVFIVRYLLEKFGSTRECINALNGLPIASSCNILLVDKRGDMVTAECSPFRINLRYPATADDGRVFQVTVNHFTSDAMIKHDDSGGDMLFSRVRYNTAYDALRESGSTGDADYAKNILSGKRGFMCQYDKQLNFDTIWSSVFDLTNGCIYRAEDNPLKTKYTEDKRLKFM